MWKIAVFTLLLYSQVEGSHTRESLLQLNETDKVYLRDTIITVESHPNFMTSLLNEVLDTLTPVYVRLLYNIHTKDKTDMLHKNFVLPLLWAEDDKRLKNILRSAFLFRRVAKVKQLEFIKGYRKVVHDILGDKCSMEHERSVVKALASIFRIVNDKYHGECHGSHIFVTPR